MLRTEPLQPEGIRVLVRQCFSDLAKIVDPGLTPTSHCPELEIAELRAHSELRLADLEGQIATGLLPASR